MLHAAIVFTAVLYLVHGDKQFDLDSGSAERVSGQTQDWDGFQVAVFSDANDEPEIVISSALDEMKIKYCLTLEEMFEATDYVLEPTSDKFGDNERVSDSEIDFQNDVTWTYAEGTDGASFTLTGVQTDPNDGGVEYSAFEEMVFSFRVAQDPVEGTSWGIEYTFNLKSYEWTSTDDTAVLVLAFEFKQCDDDFSSGDFSSEGGDDGTDDDGTDDETDETRRRLAETTDGTDDDDEGTDDENDESDDGVSSDDSQEVDVGIAVFINHGEANCVNATTGADEGDVIPTQVVYGKVLSSDEMHIVFGHFDCPDIEQDPWYSLLSSKRTEPDNAHGYVLFYGLIIGLIMVFVV